MSAALAALSKNLDDAFHLEVSSNGQVDALPGVPASGVPDTFQRQSQPRARIRTRGKSYPLAPEPVETRQAACLRGRLRQDASRSRGRRPRTRPKTRAQIAAAGCGRRRLRPGYSSLGKQHGGVFGPRQPDFLIHAPDPVERARQVRQRNRNRLVPPLQVDIEMAAVAEIGGGPHAPLDRIPGCAEVLEGELKLLRANGEHEAFPRRGGGCRARYPHRSELCRFRAQHSRRGSRPRCSRRNSSFR